MSFAQQQLRSYVDRVCNLNDEIKERNSGKSDVYKEAKANGFNPKVLKAAVKRFEQLKTDRHGVEEFDALFDMYMRALLGSGVSDDQGEAETPPAGSAAPGNGIVESPTRAHARDVRRKQRFSESMDDTKALSAEAAALGLIDPEAHAETVRIADALAVKLGAGVIGPVPEPPLPPHDPDTGEINEPGVAGPAKDAKGHCAHDAAQSASQPRETPAKIPPADRDLTSPCLQAAIDNSPLAVAAPFPDLPDFLSRKKQMEKAA